MSTDTLAMVAFMKARLDEEEPPEVCGCLDVNHWPPCTPQPAADRARREIAAIRAHLRAWEAIAVDFTRIDETEREFGAREALEGVLQADAAIWDDNADYDERWRP